jgi:hypothetical protein
MHTGRRRRGNQQHRDYTFCVHNFETRALRAGSVCTRQTYPTMCLARGWTTRHALLLAVMPLMEPT